METGNFDKVDMFLKECKKNENLSDLYMYLTELVRTNSVLEARHLIDTGGFDINYPGVFDSAVLNNQLEMVHMLLEHGADADIDYNCAPILVEVCTACGTKAGSPDNIEMIELLLKNGATLRRGNHDYSNCLYDDSEPPQYTCSDEARKLLVEHLGYNDKKLGE